MRAHSWIVGCLLAMSGCIERTPRSDPPEVDLGVDAGALDAGMEVALDRGRPDMGPRDMAPVDRGPLDMTPDGAPASALGPCEDPLCAGGCLNNPTGDCLLPHDGVQWLPVARQGRATTGTIDLETLFRIRQRPVETEGVFALDLPPLDDFRVELTLAVDWPADSADALGYFGLQWADEVPGGGYPGTVAGLYIFEDRPLRLDYRGRTALGFDTVFSGAPQRIFIERVGGRLRTGTWQTADSAWVPDPYLPDLETPPTLVRLVAACVDCTLTVESLTVQRPWHAPEPRWQACDNLLRNADFRQVTGGAPHHWTTPLGWRGPDGFTFADAWRGQLAAVRVTGEGLLLPEPAGRAPQVALQQAVALPPGCHDLHLRVESDRPMTATLDTTPTDECPCIGEASGPFAWRFTGCQGGPTSVRLTSEQTTQVRFAQLSLTQADRRCVAWPDLPRDAPRPSWRGPALRGVTPLRTPDGAPSAWSVDVRQNAMGDLVVELPPAPGRFDVVWRPTPGEPVVRVPDTRGSVVLPTVAGPAIGGLQVIHEGPDGAIASLAPTVSPDLDNPLAFARVDLGTRPAPALEARPFPALTASQLALVPRQIDGAPFGPEHLGLIADLGLDGVSIANPPGVQLATLFAAAEARGGLAIESNMFQFDAFWRDAGAATYDRWAQELADAADACPSCAAHLSFTDEPYIGAFRACFASLADGLPPDARPALVDTCADPGCPADVRCRRAFPALLRGLSDRLRAALPEPLTLVANFTLDRSVALNAAVRRSWTNNWIGRAVPARWSPILSARMDAGRFAGYAPIAGGSTGWRPQRAPSAVEHRGLAAWQAAAGVESLRLFVWPPASLGLLDAIRDVRVFHQTHAPALAGARRIATSHRAVRAWRTADRVLSVNPTARRHTVRLADARDLIGVARVWGDGRPMDHAGVLYVELPPFAALLAALP